MCVCVCAGVPVLVCVRAYVCVCRVQQLAGTLCKAVTCETGEDCCSAGWKLEPQTGIFFAVFLLRSSGAGVNAAKPGHACLHVTHMAVAAKEEELEDRGEEEEEKEVAGVSGLTVWGLRS